MLCKMCLFLPDLPLEWLSTSQKTYTFSEPLEDKFFLPLLAVSYQLLSSSKHKVGWKLNVEDRIFSYFSHFPSSNDKSVAGLSMEKMKLVKWKTHLPNHKSVCLFTLCGCVYKPRLVMLYLFSITQHGISHNLLHNHCQFCFTMQFYCRVHIAVNQFTFAMEFDRLSYMKYYRLVFSRALKQSHDYFLQVLKDLLSLHFMK